jgi:hypothetical protein
MSRDGVSATGWIARAAVVATLSLAVVACGDSPGDETGAASSPSSAGAGSDGSGGSASSASTTVLAAPGTPFPEGVYQGSLTPEDWTAQGLPADSESDVDYHVVTFTGGTVYDIAAHEDGSRETGSQWTYTVTGDQQITLTDLSDTSRTLTMEWELSDDNQLTLTMAPDQGEPEDRVLWTSHPFAKVG